MAQLERVLERSFDWYNTFVGSNPNIQDFITQIARSTRGIVPVIASIDAVDPGRGDIECPAGTNEAIGSSAGDPGVNYQCEPGAACPPGKLQSQDAGACVSPIQGVIFVNVPGSLGAGGSSGGCATPCATTADCASTSPAAQCLSGCCIELPH